MKRSSQKFVLLDDILDRMSILRDDPEAANEVLIIFFELLEEEAPSVIYRGGSIPIVVPGSSVMQCLYEALMEIFTGTQEMIMDIAAADYDLGVSTTWVLIPEERNTQCAGSEQEIRSSGSQESSQVNETAQQSHSALLTEKHPLLSSGSLQGEGEMHH